MSTASHDARSLRRLHGWRLAVCLPAVGLTWLATAHAQSPLDESCVVSVLNRSAQVQPGRVWVLPNVPANIGRVRVRATCSAGGITRSGQSDLVSIPASGVIDIPIIRFDAPAPIPERLVLTAPATTLRGVGDSLQLTSTAHYADGTTADVTGAPAGTTYTTTNAEVASIDPDGRVTAHASGVVLLTALHEGTSGLLRVSVMLSGDTDGDGIPDDVELALGLDPNDPADALEDYDGDGLTNLQELQLGTDIRDADTDGDTLHDGRELTLGTDPLLFDTDGDGVGDGLEVACGSDPLNPADTGLVCALQALDVRPASVVLVVNTILGQASRRLQVTGHLSDGHTLDLTAQARGTTYASSDLQVVNFGATDGEIFAGQDGSATVTITNSGLSTSVPVTVRSFAPEALSSLALPGARRVDVSGDFAFVAAGSYGLLIVDVRDRHNPFLVASLVLPGESLDVKIAGQIAYVAAGSAGLQVVDVSDPLEPLRLGGVDPPGEAQDLVVRGGRIYLADGSGGVRIIDATNAGAPTLLGTYTAGPGAAVGVDVSGGLAVVAYGYLGIQVIDVSNPGSPVGLGTLATDNAFDVVVDGSIAYVADYTGSLRTVDFAAPAAPQFLAQTPGALGGYLLSLAKVRDFTFGADVFFVNGVPITAVSDPANPTVRARIDFPGDATGTGISADGQFVYLVADNGVLYIGQYLELTDDAGVPPTVTLTSPDDGAQVRGGALVTVSADADDDVGVAFVSFTLDGVPVATDATAPFAADLRAPFEPGLHTVGAVAVDFGGNVTTAAPRSIDVAFNAPPSVSLTSPHDGDAVVANDRLTATATASDDDSVAEVRFLIGGVEVGRDASAPYSVTFRIPAGVGSVRLAAMAVDDVGQTSSAAVNIDVVADPGTTVVGRVVDVDGNGRATAVVWCNGVSGTSGAGGDFSIPMVPTTDDVVCATRTTGARGEIVAAASGAVAPVREGVTAVGDLVLATQLLYAGSNDQGSQQPAHVYVRDDVASRLVPWSEGLRSDTGPVSLTGLAFDAAGQAFVLSQAPADGGGGEGLRTGTSSTTAMTGSALARTRRERARVPATPSSAAATTLPGQVLWRLDPDTGQITEWASIHDASGASALVAHLSYNPRDGKFYALEALGGQRVFAVDVQTGEVTPVATLDSIETFGAGLSAGLDGRLYVLSPFGSSVPTLDTSGTSATLPAGHTRDLTGALLVAIDPEFGQVVSTSPLGGAQVAEIGGMTRETGKPAFLLSEYQPDLASRVNLYELDLATLQVVRQGTVAASGDLSYALDFRAVPQAPVVTDLIGTVVDDAGVPIEGADVLTVGGSTVTAADGTFALPGTTVPVPRAKVFVTAHGTEGLSAALVPAPGATTDLGTVVIAGGCGEPICIPAQGTYVSHFAAPNCMGTESYYLPYDSYGYSCRSWDGGGQCGTIQHTVTNFSYRIDNGPCQDAWPDGNTLSEFVTIYR